MYEGYQQEHRKQIDRLLEIVVVSFADVQGYFQYCPLTLQQQAINNLFRLLKVEKKLDRDGKENLAHDVFSRVIALSKRILTQEIKVPDWVEVEFTIQLLQHIHKNSYPMIVIHLETLSFKMQQNA